MDEPRYGEQKPRIDIYNNGSIEIAEKTLKLLDHYGLSLMPWQRRVLYRWMALDDDGKWANSDCGLSVPRQNGKTSLLKARIIGGMIFCKEAIIYTAHSTTTAEEIKRQVLRFFYDAEPEIRNLLTSEFDKEPKSFDYIELRNGARCVFRTRSRSGGLGFTNDVLILDEDQEETDAQQEALLPTISAGQNQNSQTLRVGTPPTAGTSGTVFVRTRRNVLDGKSPDYCWQEWGVESITDVNDRDAWYKTNPSLGYFLMLDRIEKEATSMAVDSFNKMRLGWFAGVESARAIPDEMWEPHAVKKVELPENPSLVYAVKFAPDRSGVSLGVGVIMPDGKTHVEIVERRRMSEGMNWLSNWLVERWRKCKKIVIDGAAGQTLLVEDLVHLEPRIKRKILCPNVKEAGAAYGGFYDALKRGEITHFNQPVLNVSVKTVKRRDIGRDGMFGYASMNADIQSDPVECVAYAYYAANRFKNERATGTTTQRIMI